MVFSMIEGLRERCSRHTKWSGQYQDYFCLLSVSHFTTKSLSSLIHTEMMSLFFLSANSPVEQPQSSYPRTPRHIGVMHLDVREIVDTQNWSVKIIDRSGSMNQRFFDKQDLIVMTDTKVKIRIQRLLISGFTVPYPFKTHKTNITSEKYQKDCLCNSSL